MKKPLLALTFSILAMQLFGQDDPSTAMSKLGKNPFFIIDSQRIKKADLKNYIPDSIVTVVILYDTSAIKLYGDSAKDGAVIIETRSFARRKYISFFRIYSNSYDSLIQMTGNDESFAYIINDKVQEGNYEGNLSQINKDILLGIEILTKDKLLAKYNIQDKQYGILVHSKTPKDLYNADKKF